MNELKTNLKQKNNKHPSIHPSIQPSISPSIQQPQNSTRHVRRRGVTWRVTFSSITALQQCCICTNGCRPDGNRQMLQLQHQICPSFRLCVQADCVVVYNLNLLFGGCLIVSARIYLLFLLSFFFFFHFLSVAWLDLLFAIFSSNFFSKAGWLLTACCRAESSWPVVHPSMVDSRAIVTHCNS